MKLFSLARPLNFSPLSRLLGRLFYLPHLRFSIGNLIIWLLCKVSPFSSSFLAAICITFVILTTNLHANNFFNFGTWHPHPRPKQIQIQIHTRVVSIATYQLIDEVGKSFILSLSGFFFRWGRGLETFAVVIPFLFEFCCVLLKSLRSRETNRRSRH